ncbi:MAG TPA: M56 family metallopeptidase [Candidatus Elarobacter sp.]|nr:M56 family metallopeptidase [Candidatus Elarobacter sp.]
MDALLLAVLNALWQGAALIALVALGLRTGLRRNATTACVVWSITFLVVALLPAIDLALARPAVAPPAVTARGDGFVPSTTRTTAPVALGAVSPRRVSTPALRASIGARVRESSMRVGGAATAFARVWGIALFSAWALVAGALLLRLARGYAAVARMKREAAPLDDPLVLARLRDAGHRRRATVARSLLVDVPCAVGFRRPMILIPAQLAASLDGDDLARVVLHESAHLQRYDDWLNALEQIVCALQFFQPALHVARRGIDFEREVACDDRVLEDAGEPLRYAECLARIVSRRVRGPRVAVAPGFVLRRAQVVGRVRRIVDRSRDASPQLRFAAVALTAVVLAATLGIARLQVPVVTAASAATPVAEIVPPAAPAARAKPVAVKAASVPLRAYTVHAQHPAVRAVAPRAALAAKPVSPTVTVTIVQPRTNAAAVKNVAVHVQTARTVARAAVPAPARTPCPLAADDLAPSATLSVTTLAAPESLSRIVPPAVRVAFKNAFAVTPRADAAPTVIAARGGGDLLEAVDEAKYPHPSVDELIALHDQGVSGDYVRRMGALRPRPALRDLLALAAQGVTPDYVAALNRRLAAEPSVGQIIALRAQGVSAAWLDGLGAIGYPKLSVDDAVGLAAQGVSVPYVHGLLDAGLRTITPSQIVVLRVQGIDGSFVRRLAEHGYHNLSIDELVRLKVSGFEP